MKIKKNDNVLVTKGKDRGKKGKVVRVLQESNKVVVGGINVMKKHQKPKKGGEKGKTISVEFPINVANVALVCPKCSAPTRVGYKKLENGEKARACKKCNQEI